MKTTKFRIWDPVRNMYLFKGNMQLFCGAIIDNDVGLSNLISLGLDTLIVEPFTGLQDKSGNDIYVNDIVHIYGNPTFHVGVEVTTGGYYPFAYSGGGEVSPDECVVVGTIHDKLVGVGIH